MSPDRRIRVGLFTGVLTIAGLVALSQLQGCASVVPTGGNDNTSNENTNDNSAAAPSMIAKDTTLERLDLAAGQTLTLMNNAELTVTGDAMIAGSLESEGRLLLRVGGDLSIDGTLVSVDMTGADTPDDSALGEHPVGVFVVVEGELTMSDSSAIQTSGNVLITDDESMLEETPGDLFDEVEDVSGDDLSTFVPLPDDNPAFDGGAARAMVAPRHATGGLPINISGVWPRAGDPVPAGDRPVIIFRFNGNRVVNLTNWTVNGPPAPDGRDADPANNVTPRNGKNGMRLNIRNNGGPINLNNVVLSLTDGGDGGSDSSACGSATGRDGGKSGNMRMAASGGINLNGPVTINPGKSGNGGDATVTKGAAGGAGCPGADGADGTATGGNGADNKKRIFVRGTVNGLANLTIGDLVAGDGGSATAEACDGGDGIACCNGGDGGAAEATGGKGGDASLNIGSLPITTGGVVGGDGGEADATGANGGNGGDCKFADAGDGGAAGMAVADSGAGGNATGGGAVGGDSGDASSTGGDGGNGGDSGFGAPGAGGALGTASASAADPGSGDTDGTTGAEDPTNGTMGAGGGALPVTILCIPLPVFVAAVPSPIPPGVYAGPILDESEENELGQISIEFVDTQTESNYQIGQNPDHIGIGDGQLDIVVDSLKLMDAETGIVGGIRIVPVQGFGITPEAPLQVTALDARGEILGMQQFGEIPQNPAETTAPQVLEALFQVDQSVAVFQISAPFATFVTIQRIYLLDP